MEEKWKKVTCSPVSMGKNLMGTLKVAISKEKYLEAGQVFHWAMREHFVQWFTGSDKRHKRTETMLPRLVRRKKLIAKRYSKRLVYTVPRRKHDHNIEHGLGCTEGLVRIWRSDMQGEIIPERHLRGFGIVPEWGILYPSGRLLLYEFCTEDNFNRYGHVMGKITRYQNSMGQFESKFDGTELVLFVCDVPRMKLQKQLVDKVENGEQFFFTDYKTFLNTPLDQQLTTPIYIWGGDGWPYPLKSQNA